MRISSFHWRALTAVLTAATVVVASAPIAAAATDRQSVITVDLAAVGKPAKFAAFTAAGPGVRLDPPMGGCYLGNVGGTITGFYTNGVLTRTESTFFSSIDCTITAPGQTMQNLWDMASINLSAGGSGKGTIGNCDYPNMTLTPCVSVQSTGAWTCPIGIRCAGDYWASHETFMTLPDGWVWSSLPFDCTLSHPQQISCEIDSGSVTIPPNL